MGTGPGNMLGSLTSAGEWFMVLPSARKGEVAGRENMWIIGNLEVKSG